MPSNDLASIFFTDDNGNHSSVFKIDVSFTNVKRCSNSNAWGFFAYVPTLAYDGFDGFFKLCEGSEALCVKFQQWFCHRVYQDGSFSVDEFEAALTQQELFSNDITTTLSKNSAVVEMSATMKKQAQ